MPKKITAFLKKENPDSYSGHSFRRTSATLLIDAGADITELKRHGHWKSTSVAEGYLGESISNKKRTFSKITEAIEIERPAKTPASVNSDNTPRFHSASVLSSTSGEKDISSLINNYEN